MTTRQWGWLIFLLGIVQWLLCLALVPHAKRMGWGAEHARIISLPALLCTVLGHGILLRTPPDDE